MSDFLKMDVFFAVTTAAIIIITVLVSIVLLRAYRILGEVRGITGFVKTEVLTLREDIARVRARVRKIFGMH